MKTIVIILVAVLLAILIAVPVTVSAEAPYTCMYCGEGPFATIEEYQSHVITTHVGERIPIEITWSDGNSTAITTESTLVIAPLEPLATRFRHENLHGKGHGLNK